jgi:SpoVK/Ycf46/Vps4 family AAA+-type ATPase
VGADIAGVCKEAAMGAYRRLRKKIPENFQASEITENKEIKWEKIFK